MRELAGSDYTPRGLRPTWRVDALKLAIVLIGLTFVVGLRAWSAMSATML